ncbi:hypothetical protein LPJ75_001169 [Coemansia sp. RSA 2598]|nr:hypothetical protein LPJ75_001169 [Coemansia sp. RSA 2598]
MTASSAASSVVGGNCLSGCFLSMHIRPSPVLRGYAGGRLDSNFSPLTLPSTPRSSSLGLQRASSIAEANGFYQDGNGNGNGNGSGTGLAESSQEDSDYSGYGYIEEYLEYEDEGDDSDGVNYMDNDQEDGSFRRF